MSAIALPSLTPLQMRRGTAAAWRTAATVLAAGEVGYETDTGIMRVGDGSNEFKDLTPFGGNGSYALNNTAKTDCYTDAASVIGASDDADWCICADACLSYQPTQALVGSGASNTYGFVLYASAGAITIYAIDGAVSAVTAEISATRATPMRRNLICAFYDHSESELSIALDGTVIATSAMTGYTGHSGTTMYVGARANPTYFLKGSTGIFGVTGGDFVPTEAQLAAHAREWMRLKTLGKINAATDHLWRFDLPATATPPATISDEASSGGSDLSKTGSPPNFVAIAQ